MPQIINEVGLGASLGQSLGQGLQTLAMLKAEQYQQRQLAAKNKQGLIAAGYDPEKAEALSGLDSNILNTLIKDKIGQPARQTFARQAGIYSGAIPEEEYSEPIDQQLREQEQIPTQARVQAPKMPGLSNLFPDVYKQQEKQAEIAENTIKPAVQEQQLRAQEEKYGPKQYSEKQLSQLAKRQSQGKEIPELTEKQTLELAKLKLKSDANKEAQIANRFKATKEERKELIKEGQTADEEYEALEELERLEDTGKLDTPGYIEFLKRSGYDIAALKNPESVEAEKIIQNFQRGAKDVYGGNVTNQELAAFMSLLPSLSQSSEGRHRVISVLKNVARGKKEKTKIRRDIMRENNNIPPYDLLEQIDERFSKVRSKLVKQFRDDLAKPVPKGQNKLITALGAVGGTAVGNIGKGLTGAGLGAYGGFKAAGVPGAVGGGILGGLAGLAGASVRDIIP